MMKMLKNTIATLAVASTAFVPIMTSTASAHDRGFSHQHGNRGVHCGPRDRNCDGVRDIRRGKKIGRKGISGGDAAGIAILGIIGGAIIGSAIQNNNQPRYVAPQRPYIAPQPSYRGNEFPPAPSSPNVITYGGSQEPWSQGWYNYCENRYRSFNAERGTYRGYDGKDHFCVAK